MQASKLFRKMILMSMLIVLAVPAFPLPAHAATCTWTGAVDTDWAKSGNWSGCSGSTPGSADAAIIPWVVSNDPILSTNATVGSLNVQSSGELTVASGGALAVNSTFTLAGTLTGDGDVTVNGSMDWSSGTMSGSGRTVIASGATLTIDGSGYKSLNGRTVENDGAAVWSGSSSISGSGGAVFENDGSFEVRNSQSFGGIDVTFNNDGVFTKTTSSGTTEMNAVFNNDGTVDVQMGVLSLNEGGVSTGGRFQGAAGSALEFDGDTHDLDAGSSVTHPNVLFEWGTVNLNGAYDVGHTTLESGATVNFNSSAPVTSTTVAQSGGTLSGSGDLVVTSAYNWTGGTMSGSGRTIIASGATLTIDGSGYKSLDGRTVENDGVAVWSGSGSIYGSGGAVFENDGSFEVRNSQSFGGIDVTFNNDGVFTKALSSGTTTMNAVFNNDGTVNVQSGILAFSGADYIQKGGVTRLNGGDIDVAYHKMDIQGGTLVGEGAVTGEVLNKGAVVPGNSPGIITVDGDYTQAAAGSLDIEIGGTTAGTGFDQLAVSGDAALAGTLNVTLDGYTPAHGDAFQIVTCDARTGVFQTLHLPTLPTGLFWRISYTGESVTLGVTKYVVFLPVVLSSASSK